MMRLTDSASVRVIYADDTLLVLDKPAGLLSVPGRGADKQDCLSARAKAQYPDALVVHRLDQATSGLLVMARGAQMQCVLSQAFADRVVHKRYIAVVQGQLAAAPQSWSVIDLPIALDWPRRPLRIIDAVHGKPSLTRWRVLSNDATFDTTRLELEPITGRSHQLRVHLQALGHPVIGDALYGQQADASSEPRLMLHAHALTFAHPRSAQALSFIHPPEF